MPARTVSWGSLAARLFAILIASIAICYAGAAYIAAQTFHIGDVVYRVTLDDVMITLRVASNIAAGYGPYFNPGENVAASTSLFWPFLLAIPRLLLSPDQTVLVICIASLTLTVLTLAAATFAARSVATAILTAAIIATSPSVSYYAWTGWEHVPQMLLVTLAGLALLGRLPGVRENGSGLRFAVVVLAIAFLIRPDALALLAIPGLMLTYRTWRQRDRGDVQALALAAALCGTYYAAHLFFYGSLLPNTFYLKVGANGDQALRGVLYLLRNVTDGGNTLLILLAIGCLVLRRARGATDLVLAASLALYVLAIVAIGGDYFSRGRFLLCITPIAIFIVFDVLWDAAGTLTGKIAKAALLLAVIVPGQLQAGLRNFTIEGDTVHRRPLVTRAGLPVRQIGAQLAMIPLIRQAMKPTDGQIGLFFLGSLSYYLPDYKFADFLGKADRVIAAGPVKWGPTAHNKWDIVYTLTAHNVAIVPLDPITRDEAEDIVANRRDYSAEAALVLEPLTQERYRYLSAANLGLQGQIGLVVRNDLSARFTAAATQRR